MKTAIQPNSISFDPAISDEARVWIFQSNRRFEKEEISRIQTACDRFASTWQAHGVDLQAFGTLYFDRFIALFVNPGEYVSGCSLDTSMQFIQSLEKEFGCTLTDRTAVAVMDADHRVATFALGELGDYYRRGAVDDETLVFNNLVSTKKEMEKGWIVPLGSSWHKRMV